VPGRPLLRRVSDFDVAVKNDTRMRRFGFRPTG